LPIGPLDRYAHSKQIFKKREEIDMKIRTLISLGLLIGLAALVGAFTLAAANEPTIDGVIQADEYQHHYFDEDINMDVYWTITDTEIFIGLEAPATGWVGFGLRPATPSEEEEQPLMQGVDIYIGYVADGQAFMRDDYADQPTGHSADTDLGGEDSILEFAGSEDGGATTLEFKRLLNTQDEYDAEVLVGDETYQEVYLAYSNSDDFTTYHGDTSRTEVRLNFATGDWQKEEEEEEE